MSISIANERTKLAANALDRASTACIAVGILSPLAGLVQGLSWPPSVAALSVAGWLFAAILLHLAAHRVLGVLKT